MTLIEIKPHRWGWKVFEGPGVEPVFPVKAIGVLQSFTASQLPPMRRSHSSRLPRKPSSQAVLKLSRAVISRRSPLLVSLTFR